MKSLLPIILLLLLFAVAAFGYQRWRASYRPKPVYPRGKRKYVAEHGEEHNETAKLLSDVLALKGRNALWPEILQRLNPNDEPRIRTVLLELRGPHIFAPHIALNIVENACLSNAAVRESPSRIELLERAKVGMEKVTRYGD